MSIKEGLCPKCLRELKEKAEKEGYSMSATSVSSAMTIGGFFNSLFGGPTKCLCTHCGQIYYEKD